MPSTPRALRLTALSLALLAAAGTSATALGAAGSPPDHGHHRTLEVTGFQEEGNPNSRIVDSARALTTVGLDGVNISADGTSVSRPDGGARTVLRIAHAHHLRAEFLVGNFGADDFSEPYAHRLLSKTANIDAVTTRLAHAVEAQGWDGVSVDLESLRARDRAGLTTFLRTLRAKLPAAKTLSICVMAATSASGYRGWGYNLGAIGRAVSRVILMAYDQHGPWENSPGPVGSLRWQRASLKALLHSVPAAKVDLGQAGYGYAWRPHSNVQLSDARARRLVAKNDATAHFVRSVGEWTAHLSDGSTLWWADSRSYAIRVKLARHHHLIGLAVWSLGLSDPL